MKTNEIEEKVKMEIKEEMRRGELLAAMLYLPYTISSNTGAKMYQTSHGTKTALGLYRTIERLVKDGE
jgi:hypothetical protein